MNTKKQAELLDSYMSQLDDDLRPLYRDIITHLSELGYSPKSEKPSISFKHGLHNKQIAKMGVRTSKKGSIPFFALRFSACREYSQRFDDIVRDYIAKYPSRTARCADAGCSYCRGEPLTHVYETIPGGESKPHCGAYAVEIPGVTAQDIDEIKKLISEEHEYLISHEA